MKAEGGEGRKIGRQENGKAGRESPRILEQDVQHDVNIILT